MIAQAVVNRSAWRRYVLREIRARIVLDRGCSPYHLARWWGDRSGPLQTRCGLDATVLDTYIEADLRYGEAQADAALSHEWLEGLQPCAACWVGLSELPGAEGG